MKMNVVDFFGKTPDQKRVSISLAPAAIVTFACWFFFPGIAGIVLGIVFVLILVVFFQALREYAIEQHQVDQADGARRKQDPGTG